ncbi:ATPase, P-type (transporting), HAD superfamily, subfamily IC/heavy metal translocating P-type ATPase [Paraburkholderia caballeronis]|uniref:P-type Zn(2+) transporter n=1 Tax=Paraburkholderia caballeronis TaxID=416943 RepID=A0A1H7F3I7_9BURK|nr:P-type E1-E2 ATPase/heavy metal translocating P-type ATPase [Paraburkholderia caballeronis]PXW99705.1 P-type E1-E2 ATPase/heavy metal translocating P-type ATPase [Paraburkholderia caballeronis]RAJ96659.1 P-type E1-E2 ATPase/heavy metal translocating P-type ATPase [Paraburkholderia caballeronis]SEE77853.1 ATPase, P-type (transporting), HAD superfamily, subfamily IC/heavy metal translocating P-type ATPase [Paraburkholderia caballeronis]SEK20384.1 ATPase, P-type (transporting), HAD superfamily,
MNANVDPVIRPAGNSAPARAESGEHDAHGPAAPSVGGASLPGVTLAPAERRAISRRIVLALAAAGLLLLSLVWRVVTSQGPALADLLAGLASVLVAGPVFAGAWHSLKSPDLHGVTDRLIALAMLAAWATGDMVTAALLPVVMTFGHALEERSVLGSQEAIRALSRLAATHARRIKADGTAEDVPAESLAPGDLLEVAAGARIPADGVVKSGRSAVDNSPITGESLPLEVVAADTVYGGAMNLDGALRVEVTQVGGQSTLGKIVELLAHAERAKPPITEALERYMGGYLALVLLCAALVWFVSANASAMLAVIVAACPCALVLAAPATAIAGIAVGARHGLLLRNAAFLDRVADLDSLIVDKTGTLTHGELHVVDVALQPGADAAQVFALAAQLSRGSSHPVSRALQRYANAHGHHAAGEDAVRELPGLGVVAQTADGLAVLGRDALLREHAQDLPAPPALHDGPLAGLVLDGRLLAWFAFADTLRPDAIDALAELRKLGLARQTLLTGDREPVALEVAAQVGIERVIAGALPHDKLEFVKQELAAGRRPLVVGDGLNDVLAIKAGATSIAIGGRGVDIAVASADVVLLGDDLRRIPVCVRLGRRCRRTATVNAIFGIAWTAAVIAVAALGVLGAVWIAVLHNIGTFIVLANAGRLLRVAEPGVTPAPPPARGESGPAAGHDDGAPPTSSSTTRRTN